jgi:hypothetical protein
LRSSTLFAALAALAVVIAACGPPAPAKDSKGQAAAAGSMLPDVRSAPGRPPVVLVGREGDPATSVAIAVMTADDANPEVASALAGVVEARLRLKSIETAVVTPSWDGLRASALATNEADAVRLAEAFRDALNQPTTDADLQAARKKLTSLAQRPLRDKALLRFARCNGSLHSLPERAGRDYGDVDAAQIERWRSSSFGLGRVAVAVTGPSAIGDAVASTVLRGPTWKSAAPATSSTTEEVAASVEVFEMSGELAAPVPAVHVTLDVGSSSAAVTTAEALGDPRGPLAARLSELDLPFRVREVTGAAHVRGGCVGVVLDAAPSSSSPGNLARFPDPPAVASAASTGDNLAAHVADAVALIHLEASVHLAELSSIRDGRILARRSGDAREAAERAAWWALVDQSSVVPKSGGGSVALGVPTRRGSTAKTADPPKIEPARDALLAAVDRARAAWNKPVVEARTRIEAGQGEVWVLLASPCGTESETEGDAGLTALFTAAAAASAKPASSDVRVEPWVVADGSGILVHGPPITGETPAAHARRLADIAARSFAAEPITTSALAAARADLLRRDAKSDGSALSILASTLSPQHPSWVVAWGSSEPIARSADHSILLRGEALRGGPLRIAILANGDASQADAAVRAADRWVARRTGETRTCRTKTGAQPPKPGTYAAPPKPGAIPEAYLAFPFAPGDEAAHGAALLTVAALDGGDGTLLDKALQGIARESSAKILGWPRAPALVVRVVAPQASLDNAVMQTRGLIDRLHKGGLPQADYDRATVLRTRTAIANALDPRARVVATWRGEEPANKGSGSKVTIEDVRAFAQKNLAEDTMVIVAARPPRPQPTPPASTSSTTQ